MKSLCVILFFLVVSAFAVPAQVAEDETEEERVFEDHWMDMPLDHFNLFDNRTWKMRYIVNDEFFVENKPIFLVVGGESTLDGSWIVSGQVYKLAEQHQGLMVANEHRYYGRSLPFGTNFTTENFVFLEIQQALEDLALFIEKFKASDPKYKNSKVVLQGCSYPGMLATWMRLKFPHLVDMSYASSAPLGVGLDYPEYYEIVNDVYANVSVHCIDTIRQGFNVSTELMKTHEGRNTVREALKDWYCGDATKMNSYEMLMRMIRILNVQFDPLHYEEIACSILHNKTSLDDFHKLIHLVTIKSENSEVCQDTSSIGEDSDAYRNGLAWNYQSCTEQGTFQTLNRNNSHHPFQMDITVQESVDECVKSFGGIVTEQVLRNGVERVTRRYGGKKPPVTRVVTVQGTKDPWKHLASLEDYNSLAPVLMAEGSHCVDMQDQDTDPEDLLEVRQKARDQITKWLQELE